MSRVKVTKNDLLSIKKSLQQKRGMEDYRHITALKEKYTDSLYTKVVIIDKLKDSIEKYSVDMGVAKARRFLVGLESLKCETLTDAKIIEREIDATRSMNFDMTDVISKKEKFVLKIASKDVNKIIKIANKQQKELANKKENGQKIGKALEDLSTLASKMVNDVMTKKMTVDQAVQKAAGIQVKSF